MELSYQLFRLTNREFTFYGKFVFYGFFIRRCSTKLISSLMNLGFAATCLPALLCRSGFATACRLSFSGGASRCRQVINPVRPVIRAGKNDKQKNYLELFFAGLLPIVKTTLSPAVVLPERMTGFTRMLRLSLTSKSFK